MSDFDFRYLQAGDPVIVQVHLEPPRLCTVDRVTPSGRIIIGNTTYDPSGHARGQYTWRRPWLAVATPELIAKAKLAEDLQLIRRTEWSNVPAETVSAVAALVRNAKAPAE